MPAMSAGDEASASAGASVGVAGGAPGIVGAAGPGFVAGLQPASMRQTTIRHNAILFMRSSLSSNPTGSARRENISPWRVIAIAVDLWVVSLLSLQGLTIDDAKPLTD